MSIIRLLIGFLCLGTAAFLGGTAYMCWAVSKNWGRGDLEFFGTSLPFALGMSVLVALALLFALGAIYAFIRPASKS